jgi:hypothetical protein
MSNNYPKKGKGVKLPSRLELTFWNIKRQFGNEDLQIDEDSSLPFPVSLFPQDHHNLRDLAQYTFLPVEQIASDLLSSAVEEAMSRLNLYHRPSGGNSPRYYDVEREWKRLAALKSANLKSGKKPKS